MKNKKFLIIIGCVVLVGILFAIIIFVMNNDKSEKSVLFCSKQAEQSIGNQYMSYELIEGKKYVKLLSINKIEIAESIKNMIIQKGYNVNDIVYYYQEAGKPLLEEKFSSVKEFVEYDVKASMDFIEISVTYTINSTNSEKFKELMGYDLYNFSVEDIKQLYESGDMICKKS